MHTAAHAVTRGCMRRSQMKKRPVHVVRGAHCPEPAAEAPQGGAAADARAWVQSVAICRGSDLAVRPCA